MTIRNALLTLLATIAGCTLLRAAALGQNLVTNGDFTAGNTGFTSGYAFVSSGSSSQPGTYGIRNNSQDFNPGYDPFADHTTGTGLMMLVDGIPNTTVWSETIATDSSAQYSFSAWVTPSDSTNPATLQFSINGVQVGSDFSLASISPGQWTQFSVLWNSGSSTSAVLAVIDPNPNGFVVGDDFALDDITFSAAVPEPSTYGLIIGGSLLLCGISARRHRRS